MKRSLALVAASAAMALAAFAGSASASPPPTPNGYVGAWNMLNDPTMVSNPGPMTRDNINGNYGMCRAVLITSGVGC